MTEPDDFSAILAEKRLADPLSCSTHEERMTGMADVLEMMTSQAERRRHATVRVQPFTMREVAALLRSAAHRLETGA